MPPIINKFQVGSRLVDAAVLDAVINSVNNLTVVDIEDAEYNFINNNAVTTYCRFLNDSGCTVTVPKLSKNAYFPIGTTILFEQGGAGIVTVQGDDGVTINGSTLTTANQFDVGSLVQTDANVWTLKFFGGGAGGLPALPDDQIWIGNGSNVAIPRTISGDGTISDTGVLRINNLVPWFETFEDVTAIAGSPSDGALLNPQVYNHYIHSAGNAGRSYIRWPDGPDGVGHLKQRRQGIPYNIIYVEQVDPADTVQLGGGNHDAICFGPVLVGNSEPLCIFDGTNFGIGVGINGLFYNRTDNQPFNISWVHSLTGTGECLFTRDLDLIDVANSSVGQFMSYFTFGMEQICQGAGLTANASNYIYRTVLAFPSGAARTLHLDGGWTIGQRKLITNNGLGVTTTLTAGGPSRYAGPTITFSASNDFALLEWGTGPNNSATVGNPVSAEAETGNGVQGTGVWRLIAGKGALSGTY